ncbi:hypothetical protein CHAB381_0812 [Campylobacter hominis ATCC BAA-381]|uniref:Uncharacterized protein n=1 Tax=Campylobacter hominis (strain ATCC BAA-381 / DSM 21671 / CCUG 45161 / LMG 19568 / NCTC 13146 / CH001A) TaxID=360107 RepID=A7I1I8_CAMHC|nr:hypothetical protein CHAB381_0812 [Campylobacter hominis ATCC BAA-381]
MIKFLNNFRFAKIIYVNFIFSFKYKNLMNFYIFKIAKIFIYCEKMYFCKNK